MILKSSYFDNAHTNPHPLHSPSTMSSSHSVNHLLGSDAKLSEESHERSEAPERAARCRARGNASLSNVSGRWRGIAFCGASGWCANPASGGGRACFQGRPERAAPDGALYGARRMEGGTRKQAHRAASMGAPLFSDCSLTDYQHRRRKLQMSNCRNEVTL